MRKLSDEGLGVKTVCEVFGVSRDAYYKGQKRRSKSYGAEHVVLKVVDSIRRDEPRVGTRKLHHRLKRIGKKVGRDSLFSLLKETGRLVTPKKSFVKTTYSRHSYAVAPNLIKGISVTRPKQVVVCDITYLQMVRGQFAYLFLVTDMFSRRIVGFHVSRDLSHYSALAALDVAVRTLGDVEGIIHHSDRGSQYCCHEYLRYLQGLKMRPSMTDEAHCYQNAIAERVNGILKDEFNLDRIFYGITEVLREVPSAIETYNTKRTHWSLGLKTPLEFHNQALESTCKEGLEKLSTPC